MSSNSINTMPYGQLGIIALDSFKEMGGKIDHYLQEKRQVELNEHHKTFLISNKAIRFSNGEGKVRLSESVRGKDIYILCDVGNYSCTYDMYGFTNHMGPDEHFQDIKRAVSALGGKARRITVIMPLMYEGRQHKRKGRESLDCALALQELERLGVSDIYSFDVHDPNVHNAVPLTTFENIYPTYEIVKAFINEENIQIDKSKMIIISPDTGAMDRAVYYANNLGLDIGLFYKRRDYSSVVNGKNPIIQHEYIGRDVEGKDVLIVDDMIASGESVFDIVKELKRRKANRVFVATAFALFTEGIEKFNKYYEEGLLDRVYSTNLTYVPSQAKNAEWFREVDMAEYISTLIDFVNKDKSISQLVDGRWGIKELLKK